MGDRVGMDPERVAELAHRIRSHVGALDAASRAVDEVAAQSLSPLSWGLQPGGLIVAPFSIAATQWAAASTRGAAAAVDALVVRVLDELAAQQDASADTLGKGFRVSSGAGSAFREIRDLVASGSAASGDLGAAWAALSPSQRDALIAEFPLTIGNSDEIPFGDRVRAHQEGATQALADRAMGAEERAYLEAVARGDRSLIVYDPEADRVIEMVGELGRNTTTIITYVPGTSASLDGFYDGSTQQVAEYLVFSDRTEGTVAFVYKDGPWANWNPFSERGNARDAFADGRGGEISDFHDVMRTQAAASGASDTSYVGVAHSAGFSALTGSEVAGASYDSVLSLGGSWIADGWEPGSATTYVHYQYGIDAINALDPFTDTPAESDVFTQVRFEPETTTILGVRFQNEVDNHVRIADGPQSNKEALDDMLERIRP